MARQTRAQQRAEKAREAEEKRLREERQRRTRMIVGGGIGVVVLALLVAAYWPSSESAATVNADTSAEAWDLPALGGDGRVAIADFVGKPTVVSFYASWCLVCEDEVPELLALSREIGNDVNFVAVNSQDNGRGLADAEKWGIAGEWPIAEDVGGTSGDSLSLGTFGMRGMPLNLVYDENGSLVYTHPGGIGAGDLLTVLTQYTAYGV